MKDALHLLVVICQVQICLFIYFKTEILRLKGMGYFTSKFYTTLSSYNFLTDDKVFSIFYLHNIITVIQKIIEFIQKKSTKMQSTFKKAGLCASSY